MRLLVILAVVFMAAMAICGPSFLQCSGSGEIAGGSVQFSPTMTASNSPSPYIADFYRNGAWVFSQDYGGLREAWKAFDGSDSSGFDYDFAGLGAGYAKTTSMVRIYMGASKIAVSSYQFRTAFGWADVFAEDWAVEGSDNGSDWVNIDTQTNVPYTVFTNNYDSPVYSVASSNVAAYNYVRFRFIKKHDADSALNTYYLKEWKMWGTQAATPIRSTLSGGSTGVTVLQ